MVGAGVAARKLWKSLRASVTVNGRGMKGRLAAMNLLKKKKKKKNRRCRNASMPPAPPPNRHTDRYDHYNYSDDDEMDNRIKKKLRKWSKFVSLPAVACVLGKTDAEPQNQFVYVTDLYAPASFDQKIFASDRECAEAYGIKAEKDANAASGSSQTDVNMVTAGQEEYEESFRAVDAVEPKMEMGRKSGCWSHRRELSVEPTKDGKMVRWNADVVEEVDTQAEVFIAKFYDEIKMQRQKSLGEYREMLERGAT